VEKGKRRRIKWLTVHVQLHTQELTSSNHLLICVECTTTTVTDLRYNKVIIIFSSLAMHFCSYEEISEGISYSP
jgi:adenosyl cobinamide kinase/adenosyl cobinamide phosphate guanylyltransferase